MLPPGATTGDRTSHSMHIVCQSARLDMAAKSSRFQMSSPQCFVMVVRITRQLNAHMCTRPSPKRLLTVRERSYRSVSTGGVGSAWLSTRRFLTASAAQAILQVHDLLTCTFTLITTQQLP